MKKVFAGLMLLTVLRAFADAVPAGLEVHYTFALSADGLVRDESAHGRDGRIIGQVRVLEAGPAGPVGDFHGGCVDMGSLDVLCQSNTASWGAWILPRRDQLGGIIGNTRDRDVGILLNVGDGGNLHSLADRSHVRAMVNGYVAPGSWQHVFVTFDGTTTRLYWNGTLVASGSAYPLSRLTFGASHACVGDSAPGRGWRFDGLIADVRVYSRVLSQGEVSELAREKAAIFGDPASRPAAFASTYGTSWHAAPPARRLASPSPPQFSAARAGEGTSAAGTSSAPTPLIAAIGFSDDPRGDQDVTEFLTGESLHVRVTDVQIVGEKATGVVTVQQLEADGEPVATPGNALKADLVKSSDGSYRAAVPLSSFRPGLLEVRVVLGTGEQNAIGRVSTIHLRPAPVSKGIDAALTPQR